jgi:hypothetical protein
VEPAAGLADNLPGYSRTAVYSDYFRVAEDPDAAPAPAGGGGGGLKGLLSVAGIGKNFVTAMTTRS